MTDTTALRGLDLAVESLAHIELTTEYDDTLGLPGWDQGIWGKAALEPVDDKAPACGTAYCHAGWVVHLAGAERWIKTTSFGGTRWALDIDLTPARAVELLGLEEPERKPVGDFEDYDDFEYVGPNADLWSADGMPMLFEATNTIDDLYLNLEGLFDVTHEWLVDAVGQRKASLLAELKAVKS